MKTHRLSGGRVLPLALGAAVATASSYAVQPDLVAIAHDLGTSVSSIGLAASAALFGYLVGLALLVPLVDLYRADLLLLLQFGGIGGGLALASASSSVAVFALGLFISGVCASCGAQMSALVAKHASPERRGRAIGAVTAGISVGILLGRFGGGFLSEIGDWRMMLMVFAGGTLVCGALVWSTLRRIEKPHSPMSYVAIVTSLPRTFRTHRLLRQSAIAGALWFFAFSLIWAAMSIVLALPPIHMSPDVIGLFGLAGLAGVVATRPAGALADRFGSSRVIVVGLLLALGSVTAMSAWLSTPMVLAVSLALFDVGLFAAQVANQSRLLSIDPQSAGKLNGVYMTVYFIGGSIGGGLAGLCVAYGGWLAATTAASAAIVMALALTLAASRSATTGRLGSRCADRARHYVSAGSLD